MRGEKLQWTNVHNFPGHIVKERREMGYVYTAICGKLQFLKNPQIWAHTFCKPLEKCLGGCMPNRSCWSPEKGRVFELSLTDHYSGFP